MPIPGYALDTIDQFVGNDLGDTARFLAPVRSGKRIRTRAALASVEEKPARRILPTVPCTVEIEAEEKPAVVADLLSRMLPDPSRARTGTAPNPGRDDDA